MAPFGCKFEFLLSALATWDYTSGGTVLEFGILERETTVNSAVFLSVVLISDLFG